MNCGEVLRHLGPYLDSECDPEVTLAISEHLDVCEACALRVSREKRFEDRLAGRLAAPEPADAALWRTVEGRFLRHGLRRSFLGMAAAGAAAAILALATGWALLTPGEPSDLVRIACADHAKVVREASRAGALGIPWDEAPRALAGRLPFALAWEGAPPGDLRLEEARPCAFADHSVALLRCRAGAEPLSVAIFPSSALASFPEAAREFALKGDAFSCGDGDWRVGLARRGGTLVCVTGALGAGRIRELARSLAAGIGVRE